MGKKVFVDLTHPFSAEIPRWPYFDKPFIEGKHSMAKGGVLTQYVGCTMHTGTHCDAPRHVMEFEFDGRRARYTRSDRAFRLRRILLRRSCGCFPQPFVIP